MCTESGMKAQLCREQGEHAHRIWNLIYSQSCFTNITDKCTERRIFHRLISGARVGPMSCNEPGRPATALCTLFVGLQ